MIGFTIWTSVFILFFITLSHEGELTFEIPNNEKRCFYENGVKGIKTTLDFQIVTGGNYDIEFELTVPDGRIIHKGVSVKNANFEWTPEETGDFKFCFNNEFSPISHKVVYFDLNFLNPDDEPLANAHASAMTMFQASIYNIHESMYRAEDHQTAFRIRETRGRDHAEHLSQRVLFWSIGEMVMVLVIGVGQVLVLKSFFTDKIQRT